MKNPTPRYPLTTRVLGNLRRQGFTPERMSVALKVFGSVIAWETGTDPKKLLARAEWADPNESVEELVEYVRLTPREQQEAK